MERIDTTRLRAAILHAPGWARVGITMPDERLRERAATALVEAIVDELEPGERRDPRQISLAL
nr:DUF6771 family protein [Sphingomonas yantingensis]